MSFRSITNHILDTVRRKALSSITVFRRCPSHGQLAGRAKGWGKSRWQELLCCGHTYTLARNGADTAAAGRRDRPQQSHFQHPLRAAGNCGCISGPKSEVVLCPETSFGQRGPTLSCLIVWEKRLSPEARRTRLRKGLAVETCCLLQEGSDFGWE